MTAVVDRVAGLGSDAALFSAHQSPSGGVARTSLACCGQSHRCSLPKPLAESSVMTKHGPHEMLHERGRHDKTTVVAVVQVDDSCPALEWLDGLSKRDRAGIRAKFQMFAEQGFLRTPDSFNQLEPGSPNAPRVDEIKHVSCNLRAYIVGWAAGSPVAYVTHGSKKPKPKAVKTHVKRAREIFSRKKEK